jgi:Bacterial protein of unknown function (DUF899)
MTDDVFHTYSAYARGFDGLWTIWQWLTARRWAATKATCRGSAGMTSIPRTRDRRLP